MIQNFFQQLQRKIAFNVCDKTPVASSPVPWQRMLRSASLDAEQCVEDGSLTSHERGIMISQVAQIPCPLCHIFSSCWLLSQPEMQPSVPRMVIWKHESPSSAPYHCVRLLTLNSILFLPVSFVKAIHLSRFFSNSIQLWTAKKKSEKISKKIHHESGRPSEVEVEVLEVPWFEAPAKSNLPTHRFLCRPKALFQKHGTNTSLEDFCSCLTTTFSLASCNFNKTAIRSGSWTPWIVSACGRTIASGGWCTTMFHFPSCMTSSMAVFSTKAGHCF